MYLVTILSTCYNIDNAHHVDMERDAKLIVTLTKVWNAFWLMPEQFDVLATTEAWFDSSVLDHEVIPSGYTIYRRDRQDRRGVGVFLAFHNDLMVVRRSDLETSCELLWCELTDDLGRGLQISLWGILSSSEHQRGLHRATKETHFHGSATLMLKKYYCWRFQPSGLRLDQPTTPVPLSPDQLYLNYFEIFNDAFLTQMNHHATKEHIRSDTYHCA